MRISKENAAKNRDTLLKAASRLFREKGIDGTGVAEVARAAKLTHGALYAHFKSKDALAAEAFSQGFRSMKATLLAWKAENHPKFRDYMGLLLSRTIRDRVGAGCPMSASASEAARQGPEVSARYAEAFEELAKLLEESLEEKIPPARRRRLALSAAAAQIGAMAVSRAVARSDEPLSSEVLRSVKETIEAAHQAISAETAH